MLQNMKWSWIIALFTLIAGLVAYVQLPADAVIPLHWDIDGNIDRSTASRSAFFLIPAIQVFIIILFAIVLAIDPRQENVRKSIPAIRVMMTSAIILLAVVQLIIISSSFNMDIAGMEVLMAAMGILFMILGNYMSKLRSSFFFGIRTPWTLSSDYVWKKTHRLAGRLFLLAGTIILVMSFLVTIEIISFIVMATILPAAIIPVIYSWVIWRRESREKDQRQS